MSHGGARTRSGPVPNPNSGRSKKRKLQFEVLDEAGYKGPVPKFSLPRLPIYQGTGEGRRVDERATRARQRRELALWEWAWTLPQAIVWAREPWRHYLVEKWVRTAVICEGPDATAADKGAEIRFADQIGMTPDGLIRNGWQIGVPGAVEELKPVAPQSGVRGRFQVIENAG